VKESPQALRAFSDYLAQTPPRSLERLVERYQSETEPRPPTRRLATLKEWSTQHGWQDRIAAHERRIAEEAAKKARQQRLQVARAARGKGVEALALLAPPDLARLPSALVRLLEYADTCERKDMGEPDQRVALEGKDGSPVRFTINIDRAGGRDGDDV
jgi:uncharacterized membrane protein